MNTKADAIEAAADGDWTVAAAIYREIGDERSAVQCEERREREIQERARAAAKAAECRAVIIEFFTTYKR